nr:septal ring lytic transglycosylase RlpA family protein [Thioalkalivibrio sp.]
MEPISSIDSRRLRGMRGLVARLPLVLVLLVVCVGPAKAQPGYDRDQGKYDELAAVPPKQKEAALVPQVASSSKSARAERARKKSRASTTQGAVEVGKISFYGSKFHGRRTASGERFDQNALTAAHPRLPFGTRLRVTNLSNGKSVVVRVNDRGPFIKNRILDVSRAAARELEMIDAGVVRARVEVL